MTTPTGHMIDAARLPADFPTHMHAGAFWEALGRIVGTFGFLEQTLGKAIFAYTGMREIPDEQIDEAYEKWAPTLQHALSDTLGSLIDTYGKAVRDHGPPVIGNFNSLVDRLRDAARLRNVLCHGAWSRKPDAEGRSVPFYVSGIGQKQKVFESPIDIAYLQQTQQATVELAYEVINSVALMGWQFPGSTGPGIPLWPSAMSSCP